MDTNTSEQQSTPVPPKVNGETVSQDKLREIQNDGSKKLVEQGPGDFRVLDRMRG